MKMVVNRKSSSEYSFMVLKSNLCFFEKRFIPPRRINYSCSLCFARKIDSKVCQNHAMRMIQVKHSSMTSFASYIEI